MEQFCGGPFWDANLTWHTDNPRFTPCFEKTVLVWAPCGFLWLFSLIEISYILKSKDRNIPWNLINISKLFVTLLLVVLTIVDFSLAVQKSSNNNIFSVDIYTPVIKFLTFILSAALLVLNKRYGLVTSGLLFLFWFLLMLCSIPQFRSEIQDEIDRTDTTEDYYQFVIYMIYFPLVVIMFLLNCFADVAPRELGYPDQKNPSPEVYSSYLSKLLYLWFDSLTWKGFRKPLEDTDLWSMNPDDVSSSVVPLFDKHWNKSLEKAARYNSQLPKRSAKITPEKKKEESPEKKTKEAKKAVASIMPPLYKAFGLTFMFGSFMRLIQDCLVFINPQILSLMIAFVQNDEESWKGYLYAVLLFATASIQTFASSQYFHRMYLVGLRIRTVLISAIYRKALRLSNDARKKFTSGEIVNLMAVDAQRFMDLTAYINMLWSSPLQIGLALYFLYNILGPSVFAGLAVMIILIPINGFVAQKGRQLQIKQMKYKDERVKIMNEVLNGIKVLKLYAWEPSFENEVLKIRDKEMHILRLTAYLSTSTSFIWSCAPYLVSLVTFATYVLSDPNNILDAQTAFVSLSLFNILRFPISLLPLLITFFIQTMVSVNRINKFMNADELDPTNVEHKTTENVPLTIENGTFSWGSEEEPVLSDINVRITSGSLVAIVGSVGSGKSSLISAFLGEMDKISGRVNTQGSIAYVSQQAWIQNCTLQDNVLFGKAKDEEFYQSVIKSCALKPDLDMLPGGDQTEIGEKGINLSGGQKQRVSVARAVYCDNDVYFLDDPLSAVDSHVGKHIFEEVIGPSGLLKNKTRLLVTHNITFLPQVDQIIVLKDGRISEFGTYKELLSMKGAFAEFLLQHLTEIDDTEQTELVEIKQQLETTLGHSELIEKFQRARSLSESPSEAVSDKNVPVKTTEAEDQKKADDNKLIETEKSETGSVKLEVYYHYFVSIGLPVFIISVGMTILYQVFSTGSNVWLSIWSSDETLTGNDNNNTAKRDMYLGVYGGLGGAQVFSVSMATLALNLGTLGAAYVLHGQILSAILRAPTTTFFDVTPVGRIINRFSKDVDVLDNILPRNLQSMIDCFFAVIATMIVISISTPIFLAVIIPIGIIYYFIQRFYIATSRQLKRLESVSRSPIYSHFGETISGASIIRAFGKQPIFVKESETKVDYNQICYYPSLIANRWLAVRLEMIGNFILFFAALFAVLGRDSLSPGLVGLSVSYALQITQVLNWLVRMSSEVEANVVAVERIKEYADIVQEAPWNIESTAPKADWPTGGNIQINNLVMRYRPTTEPVLHGITCEIKVGEKVGIVGRTGAGKSTLTLALFRIVEAAEGNIIIDGLDISKLGLHALRSRLTIIPQDPVLFSGTLRRNLDPFEIYSDNELWETLELAHLKVFVKGLPAGLNHEISEGGDNLSIGQRQLVCLARALLRKTKVLILDEATAAVDLETDDLIQKTIRKEFSSCTVLTIAHRLNTIMDSNRVLVLDKGKIVEFDAPSTLLQNKNSSFYSMAKDANLVS